MLAPEHFVLLEQIAPASFFDLQQHRIKERALLFRTRQPFRAKMSLTETAYVSKAVPFTLTAVMSGSTQVGLVVYYPLGMTCEITATTATISTESARKGLDVGLARPLMRALPDLILYEFDSRNALVAIRVDKRSNR
jgi:hypothetical protein